VAPGVSTFEPLLEVDGLEVAYHTREATLHALHDISFDVRPGEILGIVGESGCGKSTLSAALMRLLPPNGEITSGSIRLGTQSVLGLNGEEMRDLRGRGLAMIFQDPMSSLNPTFTIRTQLAEAQKAHLRRRSRHKKELHRRAVEMLATVGIPDPEERIKRFPHEFSGGMRQRIMIAMALLLEPELLIADEPTSALDVTLEAQICQLLKQLRRDRGTSIIFISHDLGVVSRMCDRVIVMYAGRVVEAGDISSVFKELKHPYTQALFASVPSRDRRGEELKTIPGRVPSLSALPVGCKFGDRCPYREAVCDAAEPRLVPSGPELVRCTMYDPTSGHSRALAAEGVAP
jgi:oligopeptide/dipeptide ABC transporter ATP-binding protein